MADSLEGILNDLSTAAHGEETVTVGGMLDAFKNRSLGVLLALFGALAMIPIIGGLPGAPLVLCAFILTAIGQSVFAQGGLWAPKRLRAVSLDTAKVEKAVGWAKPWAKRIDGIVKARLEYFASGPVAQGFIILCCALLALAFLPLSFIPWGVGLPAAAITGFGLALLGKDGLFALVGYAFVGGTIWMAFVFLT